MDLLMPSGSVSHLKKFQSHFTIRKRVCLSNELNSIVLRTRSKLNKSCWLMYRFLFLKLYREPKSSGVSQYSRRMRFVTKWVISLIFHSVIPFCLKNLFWYFFLPFIYFTAPEIYRKICSIYVGKGIVISY